MNCSACGAPTRPAFRIGDLNQRAGDASFAYERCTRCASLELQEIPADLGRYYPESYHALDPSRMDELVRKNAHQVALLLRHARPGGRLLEIGPGAGVFASGAARAGFAVDVIERGARACGHLRALGGMRVIESDDPAAAMKDLGEYDAIALWHTLEHLPDARETLARIAASLAPGGVLILACPNPRALQARALGARWWHVDAPRHVHLYSLEGLDAALGLLGLSRAHATTRHADARRWNVSGWQRSLTSGRRSAHLGIVAALAGAGLALLCAPFELTGTRGSTYTVVYRKVTA